jgi:hypothetical protein
MAKGALQCCVVQSVAAMLHRVRLLLQKQINVFSDLLRTSENELRVERSKNNDMSAELKQMRAAQQRMQARRGMPT